MKQILKHSTPVKYGRVLNNLSQIFLISLNPIQLFDKESRQSNTGKTASFFVGVIYNFISIRDKYTINTLYTALNNVRAVNLLHCLVYYNKPSILNNPIEKNTLEFN
jgi:hypothetical protein